MLVSPIKFTVNAQSSYLQMTQKHLPIQRKTSARERGGSLENSALYAPEQAKEAIHDVFFRSSQAFSLRWKILSIAIINAIALMLYFAVTVHEVRFNASLIEDLFENKYPTQLLMQSSESALLAVNRELEDAIITGDKGLIFSAEPMAVEFRQNMVDAAAINKEHEYQILKILTEFEIYYAASSALAKDMLNANAYQDKLSERGTQNRLLYKKALRSVQKFQQERMSAFSQSVYDTDKRATETLFFGLWSSLTTALVVLILAFAIVRSILSRIQQMVSSLKTIAQGNDSSQVRLNITGNDEMTELAHWFNTFVEKFERVTTESTAEIKRIAYTDLLSGLPNRRMLIETIEASIETHKEREITVLFLDLDNFKPINDQLGHEAGDELIRQAAARLQLIVDSVNAGNSSRYPEGATQALAGRLGGDEFMLIISQPYSKEMISELAERTRSSLLEPFDLNGFEAEIGVSIGISCYPQDAQDKSRLIDCADMAMYTAKDIGKNTCVFYDCSIAESIEHTLEIEAALKSCVLNNELSLVYQPKFELITGDYRGSEALLRWHNDDLGDLKPVEFIHLAEKSDVINAIGEWVLSDVCQKISDWLEQGINPGRIAINMSAKQIQDPDLLNIITPIIENFHTPCEHLEFEITETSTLHHMDIVTTNIQKIRAKNIHVSIDDFGTGQSSLQLLVNCKLDSVKIHQSLIRDMHKTERSLSIIRAILNLTETLDIQCLAGGIETYEQLHILQQLNCKSGQGYYFSKPVNSRCIKSHMTASLQNQRRANH